jgi:hypothetical protein
MWIYEFITELLNTFIGKNMKYYRKRLDFKIINIVNCRTFKKGLLAVDYAILIRCYYQTAKTRELYESTDGPTGQPTDNQPNSDGLGDFHQLYANL